MIVTNMATTVGGSAAASAISSSGELRKKTSIGVIEQVGKQKTLSLYRESTTARGQYSKDVYVIEKGRWKFDRKAPTKHPIPPFAPASANRYAEGDFEFWTMEPMTDAEKDSLKRLLTQL